MVSFRPYISFACLLLFWSSLVDCHATTLPCDSDTPPLVHKTLFISTLSFLPTIKPCARPDRGITLNLEEMDVYGGRGDA
ncbi:hypothetical protein BDZ94DRAFT_1262917 [Collybia nuda]|uniref:Secreted protein n=1 Tax=Collybia nuda TaxID=64659 RepID=A0A9P5Y5P5_9AGAR|nr:hypothetical protein BDZ94DRAFT_1262917 [Collybia nuda]